MAKGVVPVTEASHSVVLDIRYASPNNLTGAPIYQAPLCYLHPEASDKLLRAVELADRLGLRIKIFDAFRPLEAQWALWHHTPDEQFLSHPETGSRPHCRGAAVDLTLVNNRREELEMGTGFDTFTPASFHGSSEVSEQAMANRYLLMGIMTTAGWDHFINEWWHYQLFNSREYPILTDEEAETGMM